MRHRQKRHSLNRFTSWRKATVISLARNLLLQQSIHTTKARAKAAQGLVERLITLAKKNTLSAKRQAFDILQDHRLVSALFSDIGMRFKNKPGGYTRILLLDNRRGDNAPMVLLELTQIIKKEPRKPKKIKTTKPRAPEGALPDAEAERPVKPKVDETSKTTTATKEKPPVNAKPTKKFLGGLRNIFKKERDSL